MFKHSFNDDNDVDEEEEEDGDDTNNKKSNKSNNNNKKIMMVTLRGASFRFSRFIHWAANSVQHRVHVVTMQCVSEQRATRSASWYKGTA